MSVTRITHYFNYLEEYIRLTHDVYSKAHPAVFCDYYSLDQVNSIYDENYISSYQDIGDLSGLRWNKVSLYPVFFGEGSPPALNASEKGTTREDAIRPTVVVPNTGYIEPKILDYLVFTNLQGESLIYKVINIDYTMPNKRCAYKLQLGPCHHEIPELEAEVSGRYIYNDVLDIITDEIIGVPLLMITSAFGPLDIFLRNNYWVTAMDGLLQDGVFYLDLNQAQKDLYLTFPSKKIALFKTTYSDIQYYQADSVIQLLFADTFVFPSYTNSIDDSTNLSSALTFRFKPRVNTYVKQATAIGDDFIAEFYQGTDYTEVLEALNQLLTYRQGGGYTPVVSTVPLAIMINQLVAFEQAQTIPAGYLQQATNLLEGIFELRLFKKIADYAIANKVTNL